MTDNKRLLYWAAGLSLAAPIFHLIDAPDHTKEWIPWVTVFALVASAQMFYGVVLLLQPWRYDETGGVRDDADRFGRFILTL